ncbi:hypothetical protein QTO34_011185 [Cnephaeus nilssonii]|uniref:Protein S100-A9 n=1 Tax=Cnephaeus nilssonii TaxID=3371016 RepID=A0AA40HD76_CNENI|nr:hypothetical protein QTO34_011185 [Eptesicus nilssonii]
MSGSGSLSSSMPLSFSFVSPSLLPAPPPLFISASSQEEVSRKPFSSQHLTPCFSLAQSTGRPGQNVAVADGMQRGHHHQHFPPVLRSPGPPRPPEPEGIRQMVKKELPNFLKKEKRDVALIKDIMEDLDTNGDKDLSFEEFITLVGRLTEASHEQMHKEHPQRARPHPRARLRGG